MHCSGLPSVKGLDMSARNLKILCILISVSGCTEQPAHDDPPQPSRRNKLVKAVPAPLPATISDVLRLPDISIDEADGIGPGLRYWHLMTGKGSPYVYAEAYDTQFLSKLTVTVHCSEPGTINDHLKIIHDVFCRLRPDDPWIRSRWPDSGPLGFSLPDSIVHDGMRLDISRETKSTTLTVTATDEQQSKSTRENH